MYLLISIIGAVIITGIVLYFTVYKEYKSGCVGKIKFRQFLIFYSVDPRKWDLRNGCVCYEYVNGTCYEDHYLYFSPIDTIRYMIWKRRDEMEREKKTNDETYAKVLSDIQKDVTDTLEKYKNLNIKN